MSSEKDQIIPSSQLQTLQWQFQLTWKLASEVHLSALTDDACLWEPAFGSWTVRQSTDGKWYPDWDEPEPDPAPTVTIGWLTWHLIWWWSGLLAALRNEAPTARREVEWPGSAAAVVRSLETLSAEYAEALSGLNDDDLEKPFAFPWPEPRPLRIAVAWANIELMKNVAEIGCIRHLYGATHID